MIAEKVLGVALIYDGKLEDATLKRLTFRFKEENKKRRFTDICESDFKEVRTIPPPIIFNGQQELVSICLDDGKEFKFSNDSYIEISKAFEV